MKYRSQIKWSQYLTIVIIFLVVLVLFQFTAVSQSLFSTNDFNTYGDNVQYNPQEVKTTTDYVAVDTTQSHVAILSNKAYLDEWCQFNKRPFYHYTSLNDIDEGVTTIFIDNEVVAIDEEIEALRQWLAKDIDVVFINLPETRKLQENETLRYLLGIRQVVQDHYQVSRIHHFDGFLLGGEIIYETNDLYDVDLDIPYVTLEPSYKVFMCAMDDDIRINEELPAMIWGSYVQKSHIMVFNIDCMNDMTGLGFISAAMYALEPYTLYPIVNGSALVFDAFPLLSDTNEEEIHARYGVDTSSLSLDILLPSVISAVKTFNVNATSLISFDLDGTNQDIDKEVLDYYMHQMQINKAEAGISFNHAPTLSSSGMADYQLEMFKQAQSAYSLKTISDLKGDNDLVDDNLQVLFSVYDPNAPLFGYQSSLCHIRGLWDVTALDLKTDWRIRSLYTSLGLADAYLDFTHVYYPQSEADDWKELGENWTKRYSVYSQTYKAFDSVQLSKQADRIQRFLALDYAHERLDHEINLTIDGFDTEAYFILRLHHQKVTSVDNGSFTPIEEGSYIIQANNANVKIILEESDWNG